MENTELEFSLVPATEAAELAGRAYLVGTADIGCKACVQ